MRSKVNKYRLRDEYTIVGYAEQTSQGMVFTGKYPKFWLKTQQKFTYIDEAIGILDRLNRMIYEYDIVSYKINHREMRREGIVLWSEEKEAFGIYDINSKHFTFFFIDDLFLFEKDKLEIVSHVFNRPELMERFKL
ncbi:hypothetical protein GO491_08955 [Flavobacteriaceae bacterium Ap0902]|nr:hypothetical protein [Flavobacteriaceae bacterium Ap0902]